MARATINEVAKIAGVSIGTVSKALNGTGRVSEETRARVLAAAEQLHFLPRSRSDTFRGSSELAYSVGVLTSDSFGRFTIPIMLGAEDMLGPGRVAVLMCDSRGDALRERFYVDSLVKRRVDGIIVTGRTNDSRPPIVGNGNIPVVYAYAPSADQRDCSIIPDNVTVGALAVDHLQDTGRKRLVHIAGPQNQAATQQREKGGRAAIRADVGDWAIPPLYGEWTEHWGREAALQLIRDGVDFDGATCGSDQIARGFVAGLTEAGVRVPDDVGVVGTDNWDVIAEAARPPLTTVDLNLPELGRLAASLIVDVISGKQLPSGINLVGPSLVMRASSMSTV